MNSGLHKHKARKSPAEAGPSCQSVLLKAKQRLKA
jgi:hypothetical protein